MVAEAIGRCIFLLACGLGVAAPSIGVRAASTSDGVLVIDETVATPPLELKPAPVQSGTGNRSLDPPPGNPLWAIPLSSLSATRERPLFMPSRRASPPPVQSMPVALVPTGDPVPLPPPPAEARPALTLIGTVAGDAQGVALFADPSARDVVRLRVGDVVAGWMLHAVRSREVTFRNGEREEVLTIHVPNPAAAIAGADFVPNRTGEPE